MNSLTQFLILSLFSATLGTVGVHLFYQVSIPTHPPLETATVHPVRARPTPAPVVVAAPIEVKKPAIFASRSH